MTPSDMTQGEAYCYVHRQGRESGRRAGIIEGVVVGFMVGVLLAMLWWGPFQYVRGRMYRGGGMAQEQQVRLVEAAPK